MQLFVMTIINNVLFFDTFQMAYFWICILRGETDDGAELPRNAFDCD